MYSRTGTLLIILCGLSTAASAQSDRSGTWDATFGVTDLSSEALAGAGGSSLDVDGDLGYGFGFNYNFSNRFALGGDLTYSSPDYQATRIIDGSNAVNRVSASLDVTTIHFKGTFYLTEGAIAPFLEAGGGWTRVDSNIADGPPTTGCWWDPWWGYVCSSFYDTYTETRTSYSYGVGLRWELADQFIIRGTYGLLEVNTAKGENASLDTLRVDVGWRF
jgi:opacity protein-like surface antigen